MSFWYEFTALRLWENVRAYMKLKHRPPEDSTIWEHINEVKPPELSRVYTLNQIHLQNERQF